MPKKKPTIPQLWDMKREGKKIRMVTSYDYMMASLVDETDIEMILVGDSLGMVVLGYEGTVPVTMEEMLHHIKPVVRAARNTFIVGDMPFGSYNASIESAIHNANRILKEGGADAVKLEGGLNVVQTVEALVKAGIPVMAHIGLTPQTATQLGGFKVQGKDLEAAKRLIEEAQALEAAGAFAIVLECIPSSLAKIITEKISIPTIGIGAGPHCDGQVLVIHDMLGMFKRFTPKFVKKYADLAPQILDALNTYAREVAEGVFPAEEHSFGMSEETLSRLY
ncbi:ketopantoate hydroxymethyltransferase [Thermanaeromonas toyohensis ToBE]|uniref:3-methyl-2-oxobutanoate hydroxymethyltransferase n=1 Tax=Thermanaeromonas toyohensis ToBE TaxID=698762 RepID=A0A1W1VYK9_9FIRM|nr:3-methyl-2-oxobutanoate hydroxymethyltransferase [Thermanaeromonas toyohensis]SMB98459.1 ketopantoate hydroxymethyltransferase [Thermanaeromonas toyohensis ToBE]